MIPITLAEVAAMTGGRLDAVAADAAAASVTGAVVADSRQVEPGGLFVAVPGERVDGHDFAAAAVRDGAVGVLAQRPVGVPAVIVEDAVVALGELANGVLDRLTPRPAVVGVTGSSGKTSTKDLLAQVLAGRGPVIAPPGSYNTEIGVPLTVLSADETTRTLVLEMGARGIGHVAYLCRIATPTVGVVLNVGSAHVGEFGSREAIARAKSELVHAVPADGTAVLNADDPLVRQMAEQAVAPVLMFGESVHADVRADQVRLDAAGRASFTLVTPAGSAPVQLAFVGAHQVSNGLAAAAAAHALGMATESVAATLSEARALSRWRMEVIERADGLTVINDAYNANPESMRAALNALVAIGRGRRTWAVLGEMRELGEISEAEHAALGRTAARLGVDRVVAVGPAAHAIASGVVAEVGDEGEDSNVTSASWVEDAEDALRLVQGNADPGDVVLVKASRAAGLEAVAEALVNKEVTAR